MYIALISDIHANLQALEAVEQDARQLTQENSRLDHRTPELRFWCLGDIFGRGPSPDLVWEQVTETIRPDCWVVGNHDQDLVRLIDDPSIVSDVAKRKQWEKEFRSESDAWTIVQHWVYLQDIGWAGEIKRRIGNLPSMASPLPGVYLAHGSFGLNKRPPAERPRECVEEPITQHYQVATTWETLCDFVKHPSAIQGFQRMHQERWEKPSVMIVGHSHVRSFYKFEKDKWHPSLVINDSKIGVWLDLPNTPTQPVLINPGSVGSPRLPKDHIAPKDLCASYAVLDWNARNPRIMFRRAQYNRKETIRLLIEGQYPSKVYAKLKDNCTHSHSHQCPWCKES